MTKRQRRRHEKQRRHAELRISVPSRRQVVAASGITLGATLAMGGVAHATAFQVANTSDCSTSSCGSLRQAIHDANVAGGNNTIIFASGVAGSIKLGSNLVINDNLDLQGPGASLVSVDGQNGAQDFHIYQGNTASISGLTITGGKARYGGGIDNFGSQLTVANSVVTGNTATANGANSYGGGIFSRGFGSTDAGLTVLNSTISGNVGTTTTGGYNYGAGIFVDHGHLTMLGSTVSGNVSSFSGGGIRSGSPSGYQYSDSLVANSTIANNQARFGGGLRMTFQNGHKFTIQSTTIAGNTASLCCGGLDDASGTDNATVQNTIISGNSAPSSPDTYGFQPIQAAFSLIKNTSTTGGGTTETVPGSNITGVDPQLGPLANNGGPTQTMALPLSSPAVDKGSSFGLTTDQRGKQRPFDIPSIANSSAAGADGSDIGAFELQPSDLPSNAISFGKLKKNKKKGTATLTVNVPGPGTISLSGTGVLPQRGIGGARPLAKQVGAAGPVTLTVIPTGKTKKKLKKKHKAKVTVVVTFTPNGGLPNAQSTSVKLIKKR